MRIMYKTTKCERDVDDDAGAALVAHGIAVRVLGDNDGDTLPDTEISARTGKPKRKYNRRDMTAET